MRSLITRLLTITIGLVVTSSAFAAPAPCKVEKWTGSSRPAGSGFGPDGNQPINVDVATKLTIPRGRTAHLLFWNQGPQTENAMMLYDNANFGYVAKRKTAGGRDFSNFIRKGPATIIISGWHKSGSWTDNTTRVEKISAIGNMWIVGSEDGGGDDYRDFVAQVFCK
jgi:hypothetical protein